MSKVNAIQSVRDFVGTTPGSAPVNPPKPDRVDAVGEISLFGGKARHLVTVEHFGHRQLCHVATFDQRDGEWDYRRGVLLDRPQLEVCLPALLEAKKTLVGLGSMSREAWPSLPIEIASMTPSDGGSVLVRIDQYNDRLDVYFSQFDLASGTPVKRWWKCGERDLQEAMKLMLTAYDQMDVPQASEETEDGFGF